MTFVKPLKLKNFRTHQICFRHNMLYVSVLLQKSMRSSIMQAV